MSLYYFDEPLQKIIFEMKLDIEYKNIKINLMDHLPYLKKGYLLSLRYEINILFNLYSILRNDNFLEKYSIDHDYSNFIIKNCQYISNIDDSELNKIIKIGQESDILNILKVIIDKSNSTIPNIYELLDICINDKNIFSDNLLNMITTNIHMKLIYNIIKGNVNIIKSILDKNKTCPFIGYSIAKLKNDDINDYIKSICIKRMWFIKQALIDTNTDIISIILDYLIEFIK
jgi:hypothetical protein